MSYLNITEPVEKTPSYSTGKYFIIEHIIVMVYKLAAYNYLPVVRKMPNIFK